MGKAVPVLRFENIREGGPALPDRCNLAPADDVGPESDLRTRNIPPQDVQALMPGVERLVVRTLKARSTDPKDLHVVAEVVFTMCGETCAAYGMRSAAESSRLSVPGCALMSDAVQRTVQVKRARPGAARARPADLALMVSNCSNATTVRSRA